MDSRTEYLEYLKENPGMTYGEKKELMQCITYDPRPGSYYRKVRDVLGLDESAISDEKDALYLKNGTLFQERFDDIYRDLQDGKLNSAEEKLDDALENTEKAVYEAEKSTGQTILTSFNSDVEKELFLLFVGEAEDTDDCFLHGFPWLYYLQSVLYEKKNLLPKAVESINKALVYNPVSSEFTLKAAKLNYMSGRIDGFEILEDCLNVINGSESYYQYVDLVCYVYRIVMNDPYKAQRVGCYFTDRALSPKYNYRALDRECLFLLGKDRVKIRPKMMPFVPVSVCQRNHGSNKTLSKYMEMTLLDFFD